VLLLPDQVSEFLRWTVGVVVEMQLGDVFNACAGSEREEVVHTLGRVEHEDGLFVDQSRCL
jgi:hypothetical protein